MLIACDVDGVVADLHAEWFLRYNADFGDDLTIERVTSWEMTNFVKPECGKKIFDYLSHPNLYAYVPTIPGAVAGVAALRAKGNTVYFPSSCGKRMTDQKAEWLIRHGLCDQPTGDRLPRDFVVCCTEDKARLLQGDVLIEDSAEVAKEWVMQTRRRAILLDRPWNRNLDMPSMFWQWCTPARDWTEVLQILSAA